ncbi:MAG: acylneuraminate cytidylyltransferase family protein [Ignavibacteria bacterium]|nr:acylneuraminate cytidylyltransferase family protein [Ignavibacteria bacterium]
MKTPEVKALLFMKHHSERVPRKNMRDFCGKPLFHWIVESLSNSKYIDEIVINTDSEEIAKSAENNFNVTVHMRPEHLITISSNEANLIMEYDLSITKGSFFLQTHSTNPLLTTESIDKSIESFFEDEEYDSLFSVTTVQKRFFYQDGTPINHDPTKLIKTQNLSSIYEENSCIYIFSRESFQENKNRIGKKPKLFSTWRLESVDIDDMDDFYWAEFLMTQRLKNAK